MIARHSSSYFLAWQQHAITFMVAGGAGCNLAVTGCGLPSFTYVDELALYTQRNVRPSVVACLVSFGYLSFL